MRKIFLIFITICSLNSFAQVLEEFRGVKLTNVDSQVLFTDDNIAAAMDFLASKGINAVLTVVWNGGWTLYPSQVMDSLFGKEIHSSFTGRDPLRRVIIEAHRNGIEVYPWFEYGFAAWYSGGIPPLGGHILAKFPQWASRNLDGTITTKNGFDWMQAINPEVQTFMNSLVKEVLQYDIDGIEFSDRIPALPVEGGYDSVTVEIYKSEHSGSNPPSTFGDETWKRWRADKLNTWYQDIRNIIKSVDTNIFVSSSPSVYPWAYHNYLQDAQGWINQNICDHFIPQLYRYDFSSYLIELNNACSQVGTTKRHILFPGILMNIGIEGNPGYYVITPSYLLSAIQANRDRNCMGEAYFYYEGFRKNNNLLADTLRATFYAEDAIVPLRGGNVWRPKAKIVNETDSLNLYFSGVWTLKSRNGFTGKVLENTDTNYAAIEYYFNINNSAYYDVFNYMVTNTSHTKNAVFTIYSENDSQVVIVDQSNISIKGWEPIATVYLTEGFHKVVKLDNSQLEYGKSLIADATMLMINRRLSPNVLVTSIDEESEDKKEIIPNEFTLYQNYPNPFNPTTKIRYDIPKKELVTIKIYNILGQEIQTLINEVKSAGQHEVTFNSNSIDGGLSSGVYFYRIKVGEKIQTGKMILMK